MFLKSKVKFLFLLLLGAFVFAGCSDDDKGSASPGPSGDASVPEVNYISTKVSNHIGVVEIKGKHFGTSKGSALCTPNITIKGDAITLWNDTAVTFNITAEVQTGDCYIVRADGVKSNAALLLSSN
jgi:PBP1b-binding outer membrane lipoprotein LpoB